VLEFEGIGPGPLAGRMLADLGADVTVIAKPDGGAFGALSTGLRRGKRVITLNLKRAEDREQALEFAAESDALIEGNRPGVMERLGLGPGVCLTRNPRLVYGRMTGWGQTGPLASTAGHDLNYVALTGLLSLAASPGQTPRVPPTVVGDATGALGLAFGLVSGCLQAQRTGQGCVVDAAIVDVLAMLGGLALLARDQGMLDGKLPSVFHDSPFYDTYACADGGHITVAAMEPPFYAMLLRRLGLDDVDLTQQYDARTWPALRQRLQALFKSQPRQHWDELLLGTDACYAPVLSLDEAAAHPHNRARGTFSANGNGVLDVQPAPRFNAVGACASLED